MNWLIFEIKWFFKMNWPVLLFTVLLVCGGLLSYLWMKNYEPPPERIEIEAKGIIANIRNTGAWSIYDTEVKFTDGSIILLTYTMLQRYKLKRGQNISVIYSFRKGRTIKIHLNVREKLKKDNENGKEKERIKKESNDEKKS